MTDEDNRCLADLLLTNPDDDRRRIEETKGGLLNDSFCWILDSPEFQKWRDNEESRLLWIKGDAGKGKTMLMIGIIKELLPRPESLSYFLCQGTDSRLNNAIAILRGMIYLLINQQPPLISYLRKQYDSMGRKLFEDTNSFYSLSGIFQQMLHDSRLATTTTYLIVDALDECETGLPQLLHLIVETISIQSCRVKWIVSSRHRNNIEQVLGLHDHHTRLSLELNADHISHAVNTYIDHKISKLILLQQNRMLQDHVRQQLRQQSDGTFLWVALVFEELQRSRLQRDMSRVLRRIPSGLTPLYDQMMQQIQQLEDDYPRLCILLLSMATLVYRPLHMHEMHILAGLEKEIPDVADLERIINMSGSFLTIRENHIYFIHQSAKDYLTNESAMVFSSKPEQIHYDIFSRSVNAMLNTLRRDMYNLKDPGPMTENMRPNPDPLTAIRYSCVFWIDHLCKVDSRTIEYSQELTDNGRMFTFFTKHLLHWVESLSLIFEISSGILTIRKLLNKFQVCLDNSGK